jgi:prophage DNA circulation protein
MSNRRPSVFGSLFGSKSFKDVTKVAKQVPPLVKTIQAVEGIFQAGELMYNANETAGNLNDFIPKASKIADRLEAFVPSMQVMGRSFVDTIKIFNTFNTIATTVGIGANVVLTYQGVQALHLIAAQLKEVSTALAAQTALLAQKDFPQYVYDLIRERLGQTSDDPAHEPDNDWYVISGYKVVMPCLLLFETLGRLDEGLNLVSNSSQLGYLCIPKSSYW